MNCLVTGGRGFFGRYFTTALRERGDRVVTVDTAAWDGRPSANTDVRGSVRGMRDGNYDLVIHLAAFVGGRVGIDSHPMRIAGNLGIDAAFFDWAVTNQPGRVVYFSSAAAYPLAYQTREHHFPLTESSVDHSAILEPDALYGWAKVTGERLAAVARSSVPVTVVRPFSGYAGEQTLDYPFPSFIGRALRHDDPFDIWGPGDQARDWIHASDVVGAVLALVDQQVDGPVNLCTGRATPFTELAAICAEQVGYTPHWRFMLDQPQGPFWRVGDPSLLNRYYAPQISVERGIEMALSATVLA